MAEISAEKRLVNRDKLTSSSVMYFIAQSAFFLITGTVISDLRYRSCNSLVSIPLNKKAFSRVSLTYVSINKLYVSACTCSIIVWKA